MHDTDDRTWSTRVMPRPLDGVGIAVGVVFVCWSLTPSLVPRSWSLQAIASGILAAIGYGIGTAIVHVGRNLVRWRPSRAVRRAGWRVLAVVAPVSLVTFLVLGAVWQEQIHALAGTEAPGPAYIGTALVGTVVAAGLVGLARGVRWTVRQAARPLHRHVPESVAHVVASVVVVALVIGLLDGVVARWFFATADELSRAIDQALDESLPPPSELTRSGGPGSLIRWEDLGSKGRTFVAGGPTPDARAVFAGSPVVEPIRIYAGLESAADERERAVLAVDDLERAGGFDREVLAVVVPTGTGRINPVAVDALEYLHAGDTAVVAMQYSYLPSWLSYLVDRERAREAGRLLFNEVHDRWRELPDNRRPRLVVYGESLGSYGSEAAFSGIGDLRARVDGVLWVGPPNFAELRRDVTEQRDPGSLARLPSFEEGRTVRFAADREHLDPDPAWEHPRVVYLQFPSDPVVWWSPRMILRQPEWLREARDDTDLRRPIRWYPVVTFVQVTIDLLYEHALELEGYGHSYGTLVGEAWSVIVPPDDWDDAVDRRRLVEVLRTNMRARMADGG